MSWRRSFFGQNDLNEHGEFLVRTHTDKILQWGLPIYFIATGCTYAVLHGDPKHLDVFLKCCIMKYRTWHNSAERMIWFLAIASTYEGEIREYHESWLLSFGHL